MKKWNNAEIMELDINETANGLLWVGHEIWPLFDKKECGNTKSNNEPSTPLVDPVPNTPVTPDTSVTDRLS